MQTAKFLIAQGRLSGEQRNRATIRWVQFHNDAPYNSGGGINTLERATDFLDAMDSMAGQLSIDDRGEQAERAPRRSTRIAIRARLRTPTPGTGPAVTVTGIAGFGGPLSATGQGNAGFDFKQNMTQVIDNFTYSAASTATSSASTGSTSTTSAPPRRSSSTRSRSVAVVSGREGGANPLGYTHDDADDRRPRLQHGHRTSFSAFVQDDWQIAPKVKLLYGLRYDLYRVPGRPGRRAADADARASTSTGTTSGRALGVAWADRLRQTVLRASTGIMYDQAILGGYEQALQFAGSSKATRPVQRYSGFEPTAGAPAFPSLAATGTARIPQSPWAVDPAFQVAHTWQSNAQLERAFGSDSRRRWL